MPNLQNAISPSLFPNISQLSYCHSTPESNKNPSTSLLIAKKISLTLILDKQRELFLFFLLKENNNFYL